MEQGDCRLPPRRIAVDPLLDGRSVDLRGGERVLQIDGVLLPGADHTDNRIEDAQVVLCLRVQHRLRDAVLDGPFNKFGIGDIQRVDRAIERDEVVAVLRCRVEPSARHRSPQLDVEIGLSG